MSALRAGVVRIDKNIPVAQKKTSGRMRLYPWHEMQVGDSFLFPKGIKPGSCYRCSYTASRTYGKKFVTRKTDEGYRCWRMK